ncbi:MAG: hypothetical protein JNJ49_03770 [Bdellovibrionaceae bacterium]|nr:hypothetical protein [Pseudobdellovibrionaceae bacterium]
MKFLVFALALISSQAMASNCEVEVAADFAKLHPKYNILGVEKKGQLRAGEEKPYLAGEIWNETNEDLDIYEIHSGFMASFVHVALVKPATCEIQSLSEVLFE